MVISLVLLKYCLYGIIYVYVWVWYSVVSNW